MLLHVSYVSVESEFFGSPNRNLVLSLAEANSQGRIGRGGGGGERDAVTSWASCLRGPLNDFFLS